MYEARPNIQIYRMIYCCTMVLVAFQMHGATYTVDAEFKTDALVEKSNWVVDIGAASEMLGAVLSKYNFKNLNEIFPGQNTTTEFMCKVGGFGGQINGYC